MALKYYLRDIKYKKKTRQFSYLKGKYYKVFYKLLS